MAKNKKPLNLTEQIQERLIKSEKERKESSLKDYAKKKKTNLIEKNKQIIANIPGSIKPWGEDKSKPSIGTTFKPQPRDIPPRRETRTLKETP